MTPDERRDLAEEILCELSKRKMRATYGAVGCILGVLARGVGKCLGDPRPKASWVVAGSTNKKKGREKGKPTGYSKHERDPRLYCNRDYIKSCSELRKFLGWPLDEHGPGCKAKDA